MTFQFELVSPEELILSKAVAMVTVPGGEGEYGVLPGHAPMITTMRPGVIRVYGDDETTITDCIFVAGGFAEVTEERCTVLVEEAMPVSELHQAQLEVHLKALNDDLVAAQTDAERASIENRLAVVNAKLEAVQKH